MINTVDLTELEPLLDQIRDVYIKPGLQYGWKSNVQRDYDFGHWNKQILIGSKAINYDQMELPYIDRHPLIKHMWEQLQSLIGPRKLVRAYVNGYTYGTDAYYHKDDTWLIDRYGEDVTSETILLYMNTEDWNRDWGGETAFIDDDNEFIGATLPKRNRCVIFDSNLWHSARPLSRSCPHLRTVLVFKTAGDEYNDPAVKWIKERTEGIPHSGTDLFYHLYNTAMTVGSVTGMPHHIIRAALYHSVYGTAYFDPKLGVTRDEVREQIGEEAENLVHIFCTLEDRYNDIMNNSGGWGAETRYGLLSIELANTLEMGDRSRLTEVQQQRISLLDQEISKYNTYYESN